MHPLAASALVAAAALGGSISSPQSCTSGVRTPNYDSDPPRCRWERQGPRVQDAVVKLDEDDFRFKVKKGYAWDKEQASNPADRSEIKQDSNWPMGSDIYLSYDLILRRGFPSLSSWVVLGQLHQTPNKDDYFKVSPPFGVYVLDHDRLVVIVRSSRQNPLTANVPATELLSIPGLRNGQHYRLAFHIRYSPNENGRIDGWVNGEQRIKYRGPVGYPASIGPYLKFGIYRGPAADEMDVEYRHLRFGDDRSVLNTFAP